MANNEANMRLNADASGVVKGVAIAQGALGKLQTQLTSIEALSAKGFSMSGLAGIGLSATAAVAALVSVTTAAADYGDQLDNMSQRTGVAVEDLAKLQFAAKMSDTSNEALGKGLAFLSGQIVSAGGGAKESAALFDKYGIAVRNADGSARASIDVLGDLADVFSVMPDGTEKAALATEFFGKKLGAELIPLLNVGKAGLKALGDEAERLGLVMSADQAKAAAEFNDNLDRLSALASAAGKSIGNVLIPHINTFIEKLLLARDNGLSVGQILFDVLPKQSGSIDEQIAKLSAGLAKLKAARDDAMRSNLQDGGSTDTSDLENQIAAQEKLLAFLEARRKKTEVDEEAAAARRVLQAGELARKLAELENKRAVVAGKVSADVLKSDKDLNDARIKDAERLRDALRTAYEASKNDAAKAADEATRLLEKAAGVRTSAKDKATQMRESGLSEEEKQAAARGRAEDALGQGSFFAAAAGAAKLDGRAKDFEKYAKQAEQFLERAQKFAEESGDANLVEEVGNKQAAALEQQARAKQAEAEQLKQQAADQMATLNSVEAKLKELTTAAANIQLKADVTQLESEVARLRADISKGAVMPITAGPAVNAVAADVNSAGLGGFAGGGWTGWGGKYEPAGIVHRKEYVTPSEITAQRGVIPFLELLRKHGNKVLPGYAGGGLVSLPMAPMSSASASAGNTSQTPLVLDFGSLGRYQAEASQDTAEALTRVFRRAGLQFGKR